MSWLFSQSNVITEAHQHEASEHFVIYLSAVMLCLRSCVEPRILMASSYFYLNSHLYACRISLCRIIFIFMMHVSELGRKLWISPLGSAETVNGLHMILCQSLEGGPTSAGSAASDLYGTGWKSFWCSSPQTVVSRSGDIPCHGTMEARVLRGGQHEGDGWTATRGQGRCKQLDPAGTLGSVFHLQTRGVI